MTEKKHRVNHDNIRLDSYLQTYYQISRVEAKQWIVHKKILVNGSHKKPSYLVRIGDELICDLTVSIAVQKGAVLQNTFSLDYIYEDQDLIVINKPNDLVVHRSDSYTDMTLVDRLMQNNVNLFHYGDDYRQGIVHRLDRFTEGLMVVVKSKLAYQSLTDQFREKQVKKYYYAMLKGNLLNDELDVDQPIGRHTKQRHKYCVQDHGKPSLSRFSVIKRYNSMTLCNVALITGRTHQIRVHAHYIGHPLIGDHIYSKGDGQLLQSFYLSFFHPRLKLRMSFEIPMMNRMVKT